jgi:hypothetical protein
MTEDRLEHKMSVLLDRLGGEFPGLNAVYRFGSLVRVETWLA